MEKEIFKRELEKSEPIIQVADEDDFKNLLYALEDVDVWTKILWSTLKLDFDNNGLSIFGKPITRGAIRSITERAGISGALSAKLAESSLEKYAGLINDAMKYASVLYTNDCFNVLERGGNVLAIHSNQYTPIMQRSVYEHFSNILHNAMPEATFCRATYTHDMTVAEYSLGSYQDALFKAYREAWVKSGRPEATLKKAAPVLVVKTSDTGLCSVILTPYLRIRNKFYLLGDSVKTKTHRGAISSETFDKSMEKSVESCYAKLEKNLDGLAGLINLKLQYPIETCVRVLEKSGLAKRAKQQSRQLLSKWINNVNSYADITAYDCYQTITEMADLSIRPGDVSDNALRLTEMVYRTISLDWRSLDRPGIREIL